VLTSVSYHFMTFRLVQIEATLAGPAVSMAPLSDSLDALLGESTFSSVAISEQGSEKLPQAVYHWTKSDLAHARLNTTAGADEESFVLMIQHPRVADAINQLPAL